MTAANQRMVKVVILIAIPVVLFVLAWENPRHIYYTAHYSNMRFRGSGVAYFKAEYYSLNIEYVGYQSHAGYVLPPPLPADYPLAIHVNGKPFPLPELTIDALDELGAKPLDPEIAEIADSPDATQRFLVGPDNAMYFFS